MTSPGEKQQELQLRLLTYNIHWCVGTDRAIPNPERIGRVISTARADVCGCQEVHRNTERFPEDQARKIADATGSEGTSSALPCVTFGPALRGYPQNQASTVGDYGNALISRWPCVTSKSLVYQAGQGWSVSQEPRGCLACQYDINGKMIWVITTHLGCDFTGQEQARAAVELVEFAESLGALDRTLICGDFNTMTWQSCHRILRASGWVDCWENSICCGGQGDGYFSSCTSPAPRPITRIDYIYRHSTCSLTCESIEILRTGEAAVASDHFGLLACFST